MSQGIRVRVCSRQWIHECMCLPHLTQNWEQLGNKCECFLHRCQLHKPQPFWLSEILMLSPVSSCSFSLRVVPKTMFSVTNSEAFWAAWIGQHRHWPSPWNSVPLRWSITMKVSAEAQKELQTLQCLFLAAAGGSQAKRQNGSSQLRDLRQAPHVSPKKFKQQDSK